MEFEVFIDSFCESIRLFKDRVVILQSDPCGLSTFIAKMSPVGGYSSQDLGESLVGIMLKQLEYSFCIESMLRHQVILARSDNVEREFSIRTRWR